MKNVQLFEEFVNNLSSNPLTEADAAAAEVWPDRPPFQANVQGSDGKFTKQIITNPAYFADKDLDAINLDSLGVLEKDLPKEYAPYKDRWALKKYPDSDNFYLQGLVDYIDDKDDKVAEEFVYRLIYGDDSWMKKYHPKGIEKGAKALAKGETPESVKSNMAPPLKDRVFLQKSQYDTKWVPAVELYRAAYCKDEAMETLAKMKSVNPEFYKAIVDCYKYWMDNVNKAGIKNVSVNAGKPKKKPTA
jgi:hypothetical protein